jgi:hypothetical protein
MPGCGGPRSDLTSIGCFNPSWAPDGTRILFNRFQPVAGEDIYTVNADGSGLAAAVASTLDDEDSDGAPHPLLP